MSGWRDLLRPELASLDGYHVERSGGVVYMDANESPYAPSDAVRARMAEIAGDIDLNRYPDAAARRLREAIAAHHGVDPDRIVVGNGSDEVLGILITALAAPREGNARPIVAHPVPSFSMYGIHARCHGAEVLELPTGPEFELDVDRAAATLAERQANLFFLARPNNPTGTLWPRALAERTAADAGMVTVVDEAYGDLAGETCLDMVAAHPNVVVMGTLSKVGFAALRVGWAICDPALAAELEKVRLPYNLDTFCQAAATEVLEHWDEWAAPWLATLVAEREALATALAALGLHVFPSRANLLLVRVAEPDTIFAELAARGILVRNLHREGTPLAGCLRITVGTPDENRRLLDALREILA